MAKDDQNIPVYNPEKGESFESAVRSAIEVAKDRKNSTRKAKLTFNGTELVVTRYDDVLNVRAAFDKARKRQRRRGPSGFCTK